MYHKSDLLGCDYCVAAANMSLVNVVTSRYQSIDDVVVKKHGKGSFPDMQFPISMAKVNVTTSLANSVVDPVEADRWRLFRVIRVSSNILC